MQPGWTEYFRCTKKGSTGDHETFAWQTDRQTGRQRHVKCSLSSLFNIQNSRLRVKVCAFFFCSGAARVVNLTDRKQRPRSRPCFLCASPPPGATFGGGGGGAGEKKKKIPNTPNWGERERERENGLSLILLWNVYIEREAAWTRWYPNTTWREWGGWWSLETHEKKKKKSRRRKINPHFSCNIVSFLQGMLTQ